MNTYAESYEETRTVTVPKTIESIRALRAVACLLVALFHLSVKMESIGIYSPLLRCFKSGFGGVDLFFIVSGFVIMYTNSLNIGHPERLLPYVRKRFGRIFSIYWIVGSGAGLLLTWLHFYAPSLQWLRYPIDAAEIIKAFFLLPTHESILPVTWTLSYEVYFYLLFGLMIFSRQLAAVPLAVLAATLLGGMLSLSGPYTFLNTELINFLISPYNLEFCLGVICCLLVQNGTVRISTFGMVLAALVFALSGELIQPYQVWWRVIGFGIPVTILLLGMIHRERFGRLTYPQWLLHIGDASYVLYLIHIPIIMVVTHALQLLGFHAWVLTINLLLFVSLVWFSIQIHLRIEKPLLRAINRPARRSECLTISGLR
ncbi:acyltransferase family protein [Larkinella soli]|uniref:acyltransferase family protein n=1 Tax=Larkinella soli TaxID=1770527 RepID=UPI000FFC926B|nr:acyltransferase [Larkinella soli]